jgi:hypothetical protein
MAVYLDEAMMGRDPNVVGFPHILLCMSFVLRTPAGLWGVHLETPETSGALVDAFLDWVATHGLADFTAVTDVYACCNHLVRYGATGGNHWETEVRRFTTHMVWRGPVHGFDTSVIAPRDGTYIEFRHSLVGQPCKIFYDVNEGIQVGPSIAVYLAGGIVAKYHYAQRRLQAGAYMKSTVTKAAPFGALAMAGAFPELNYALRLTTFAA